MIWDMIILLLYPHEAEMANNRFVKYHRIPHLDEVPRILDIPVEVYEKIDGGNAQVRQIDGRLFCGSRAHFLTREKSFGQAWFRDFQKWALGNYSFYNLVEDLIIYGEWTAKHTLSYKPEFTNKFFMIDVLDLSSQKFIPYENSRQILSDLEIKDLIYLPNLSNGKTNQEKLEKMLNGSEYRYGDKEGLVIKSYDSQEFAKLWTSSVKRKGVITPSDIESIVFTLGDSNVEITRENLIDELERDFRRSNRQVPLSAIKSAVENYLDKLSN